MLLFFVMLQFAFLLDYMRLEKGFRSATPRFTGYVLKYIMRFESRENKFVHVSRAQRISYIMRFDCSLMNCDTV
jgi:hypothetical protein